MWHKGDQSSAPTNNHKPMNQPEQLFRICQYTERQGHQVIYEIISSQRRADETAEQFNDALADRGIPGSVCSWYSTGPHSTAPHTT
ncbi:hypothetical protein [uncultured Mediterranean phage uvMED]|nr:hypothetical protein [uncultured Mediterranean phage uvMED]BAQ93388.1 hypothetical protein [uncultured Mediterranean phage uvMED]